MPENKETIKSKVPSINYYLILGLDFDPPVTDEVVIKKHIEMCKVFWSKNAGHSTYGLRYKTYSSILDRISMEMCDPNIRNLHSDAAQKLIVERVEMYIKTSPSKTITHEKITAIINEINRQLEQELKQVAPLRVDTQGRLKISKFVNEEYLLHKSKAMGYDVSEKIDYKEINNRYYKNPPKDLEKKNKDTFNGYKSLLDAANKVDLYDYLGMDKKSSVTELNRLANERYTKVEKHDIEAEIEKQLASAARNTFDSDNNKKAYDLYLSWIDRKKALEYIKSKSIDESLLESDYGKFIDNLTSSGLAKNEAIQAITAYCSIEGINPPWQNYNGNNDNEIIKLVICRSCGAPNNVDGIKCGNCGALIAISCPHCGKQTPLGFGDKICIHCKKDLSNARKSLEKSYNAKNALDVLNYPLAEELLKDADTLWPQNPNSKEIRNSINSSKERYAESLNAIAEAIKNKKYFEAKVSYSNLQKRISGYINEKLEDEISSAIDASNKLYYNITPTTSEKDLLSICSMASNACSDNPKILALLEGYIPEPAENLKIFNDSENKIVRLSWTKSRSEGDITYIVARKENNAPANSNDGEINNVPLCEYQDDNLDAGKCYYYAVFTKRAGVCSLGVYAKKPIITNFKVQNLKISPGDKKVIINWKRPPANANIEITRDGKVISQVPKSGYEDKELNNDKEYCYAVRLNYLINSINYGSEWVEERVTPLAPPNPINTLHIHSLKNHIFEAKWDNPEKYEVKLYYSNNLPSFRSGEVVSSQDLENKMRILNEPISDNKTTFKLTEDPTYLTAVITLNNDNLCIGNIIRASENDLISIKDVQLANGEIVIWLDKYPKGTKGFWVMYGFSTYPRDPSDNKHPKNQKIYIRMRSFQSTNTLNLKSPEDKDYYISVFADMDNGDEEPSFDIRDDKLFNNSKSEIVVYSIQKKILGKKYKIIFETDNKKTITLPAIEIRYLPGMNYPPVLKTQGENIQEIQSQQVCESLSIDLLLPKSIPKGSHVKPFFKEEENYNRIELKLKSSSTTALS